MAKLFTFYILFFFGTTVFSQKTNPIIFAEFGIGYGQEFRNHGGFTQFTEINYETHQNLFSARFSDFTELKFQLALISPVTPIPIITPGTAQNEIALLYGRRFTQNNFSYSFSAGISANKYIQNLKNPNNEWYEEKTNFVGVPFELNIKWFKREKSRYRIYEIIPVGKVTGFGNSIGFKLLGNISKHSFLGLGIVYGIGYHKEY